MSDNRKSIAPTYDSRETGDRYSISAWVSDKPVTLNRSIPDPFVRQTVTVGFFPALWALLRHGCIKVEVHVDGDPDIIEDVLELDANWLGKGERRKAFKKKIEAALENLGE